MLDFPTSLTVQTMARYSATVAFTFTLVLLFLVTVSHARVPSDIPEGDVIDPALTRSHAGSDASSVLHLPSDRVNDDVSRSNQPAVDIPESVSISVGSIPLRVSTFRPINRHFPISSSFRFRNCRHHHQHHHDRPFFKPIGQQQQQHVKVPYGNDMILSTGESNELDPFIFHHGRMRRIPAKLVKFHHHHHDDHHEEDDDGFSKFVSKHSHRFGEEKFKKHLRHHEEEEDEDNREEMKERVGKREEEGSFMKRIRKFLDRF
ncbi:unnamed protein product [Coffea canephora]|uniref:Uncharacterized protein n=1 Tax=Coffea canephora TaxID=49390 RepID=A0A068UV58_COFCA|nr:unnamed protein product [Coffea canephora]